jgi:multicomponent Na+:H+ antiporter subunit E
MFLLNVLLAVIWMTFRQSFSPMDFMVGFLFGLLAIVATQYTTGRSLYGRLVANIIGLISFSTWMMIKSTMALTRLIVRPGGMIRPGIIGVPLTVRSDAAITMLAHLISLTPGTFSLNLSHDQRTLYVHTISVNDANAFRRTVKRELEQRITHIFVKDEERLSAQEALKSKRND